MIEVDVTEPEQRESRGIHNFSIKTNSNTINWLDSYSLDRGELPAKEGIGSSDYWGPDQPYDHKPHKPGSGWWEYTISIIESVYWQPLYVTQNTIGYSLLVTPKDSAIHGFALSWIPLTVTLIVGWSECTHWNTESPLFNQIEEQEENRRSQLEIITVPLGTSESTSGSHEQKPSQPAVATQASERRFSIANIPGNSGNSGGDRPPSRLCHTYNKNHCPICSRPCLKRPIRIIYSEDWVPPHMTEAHCNPISDGSITCSVNDHSQTVGKKPGSYLVSSSAETSTVATEAASTTRQLLNPSRVRKQKRADSKKYPCNYPDCGRSFGSRDSLSAHKRQYHSGPQTCDLTVVREGELLQPCGQVFSNSQALVYHKRRDHTGPQTCDETVVGEGEQLQSCGQVFKNAQALLTHKRTYHSGPQTCDETVVGENDQQWTCGQVFKNGHALASHKRREHSGPQTCDETVVGKDGELRACGTVCENPHALSRHKRRDHTGPQTCDETVVGKGEQLQPCGKFFKNVQSLQAHKRTFHSGPQTCDETVVGGNGQQWTCGQVFKNGQALMSHKRKEHLGPQTCYETVVGKDGEPRACGTVCENPYALSRHKRRDHSGPQTCDVKVAGKGGQQRPCGQVCNNAKALSNHKWKHHRKRKLDGEKSND